MTTEKDRPGETIPLEQIEAFEIAAMKDPGIARVELAQSGVTPIEVHRPAAGQTLNITVVASRPLKIDFNAADVKAREVVKDDLVLEFDDGGKIVLKECMTAFGMLGEVRTTIIQPDGKHYAFTELLSPTAGPRTADRAAPGTSGDVVIIQKPHAGDTEHFKLTDQKPMVLNFGFGEVSKSVVGKDGSLVLPFKDGAVLVLEGYSALKDNHSVGIYFAKGDKIALADLAPGAGPDEGAEGGRLFTEFASGGTLPGLDHLGPLGPLPFTLIPPPLPPPRPPEGEHPTYFIKGPGCLIEDVDPAYTFGVTNVQLQVGQTRSVDIHVEFAALQAGRGAASFADFVGHTQFLFNAIQAAAASEAGITVADLGNGAVRVTFAANASTNQLTFNILPVDDGIDEPIEDFRFVLNNEQVTGGATPGVIVVGPGTSFVDSQLLDLDEHQVTISDAVGNEGDKLVFDVHLSNPIDKDLTLDLHAQPLVTVNTNAATPGVDFEAGNFEYSIDGGATWLAATGPNGTIVTIPAGTSDLKVRIDTFTDGVLEGDESFLLTVANKDQLDHCDVTKIVDGAGYIFDSGVCHTPPPDWFVCGPPCLIEEVDPTFTLGISDLALQAGQERSIDVRVDFASFHTGHDAASFADLGGNSFLFDALSDAASNETGITVADLGNGAVRVTFAADASTTQLAFNLEAVQDNIGENIEDFRIVLDNSQATNGAQAGVVTPGEGSSFVTSHIVESDEYSVVIGDDCGCPPEENTPPRARDDSADACGAPVTIAVLDNDSDSNGDTLRVEAFTDAANGTLVLNQDGTFTYTPVANFTGTDSFSYAVGDGNGGTDTAVVTITVRDGEVCDCEIPPPPPCDLPPPPQDCDGPRRDWSNNRGNWSASTNAAFAALIGLPLAEGLQNHDDNGRNWQSGDDHHGDGRHGSHTQNASGPGDDAGGGWTWSNGNDDHRGRNGSDGETEHSSGWKWTNWDDRGDSQESHSNHSSGDRGSNGWPSPHETGPQPDSGDGPTGPHIMAGPAIDPQGGQNGSAMPVISGTAGDDTLVAKAGFAEIRGGAGFDTFKFDDSGVLDLALLSGKVTGIEKADITGTGNVELKLTFQDLLTMTDSGHQLTIVGDSGDKVSADLSGHNVAVADMGAFTRYVIDGGAATLDIDNHVQKNIVGI